MEQAVGMLETLVESGAVPPEELESLRGMLSQSMGMPVEEMLERKEELMARLPAEGKPVHDLIAVSCF